MIYIAPDLHVSFEVGHSSKKKNEQSFTLSPLSLSWPTADGLLWAAWLNYVAVPIVFFTGHRPQTAKCVFRPFANLSFANLEYPFVMISIVGGLIFCHWAASSMRIAELSPMEQRGPADSRLLSFLRSCLMIEDAGVHRAEEWRSWSHWWAEIPRIYYRDYCAEPRIKPARESSHLLTLV